MTTDLVSRLEQQIGYSFKNKDLLVHALTHRSFIKEQAGMASYENNERLEFLGDAVLSLVTAEEVFAKAPHANEGILTQLRAAYVCQANLAQAGKRISLGGYMRVAKGMRLSGPVELPSVLSDVVEAIFGAVYLDGGFLAAKALILNLLGDVPQRVIESPKDPKTELQEIFQATCATAPIYTLLERTGPAHAPLFIVEVSVSGKVLARGEGSSKKEATQEAAKKALTQIESLKD